MNKLYGIIISRISVEPKTNYYYKCHTPVKLSDKGDKLLRAFTRSIADNELPMFAAVVCNLVLSTELSRDIKMKDSENTYFKQTRPSDSTVNQHLFYNLTQPASELRAISKTLDKDIQERLEVPTWTEYAAAICLQLLRENISG